MPSHDIKGRVIEFADKELIVEFVDDGVSERIVFKGGNGCLKVAWIGQAICTNGTQGRELVTALVDLKQNK